MSKTKKLIWIIALTATFSACTEKIDMSLKDAAPVLMIEANLSDTTDLPVYLSNSGSLSFHSLVLISQTTSYTDTTFFHGMSGATVTINDGLQTDTLTETPFLAGAYINYSLSAQTGKTYTLSVQLNGKTYQANSTANAAIPIDSLVLTESPFGGDPRIVCYFRDPVGVTNYYKADLFKNRSYQSQLNLSNDELTDGTIKHINLDASNFVSGDTIDIFLKSLDKGAYDYFYTLKNATYGSAAPSNPTSNITGGSLGYFNAYTSSHQQLILP